MRVGKIWFYDLSLFQLGDTRWYFKNLSMQFYLILKIKECFISVKFSIIHIYGTFSPTIAFLSTLYSRYTCLYYYQCAVSRLVLEYHIVEYIPWSTSIFYRNLWEYKGVNSVTDHDYRLLPITTGYVMTVEHAIVVKCTTACYDLM